MKKKKNAPNFLSTAIPLHASFVSARSIPFRGTNNVKAQTFRQARQGRAHHVKKQ